MSFDLYLLPLKFWQGSAAVEKLLERSHSGKQLTSIDVRSAAGVLGALEPRYTPFRLNYAEIARFAKISVDEAMAKYAYVQLNGPEDADLAQFVFYRNHVEVHWYGGTSESDMFLYLGAIAKHAGLSLFDPQDGKVYRLNRNGEFK
jgi:hypothetical protein